MANVSSSNGLEKRPKLRFPGFDEPWSIYKAEELFKNVADKNHPTETVLTIIQSKGTLPREQAGRNIHYDDASLANYKKVEQGDFIIHLRSFEGGLEMANEDGIVSPAYTILRCKKPHSSLFYEAYFHTDEFINHILSKSVEGIRDGRQISYEAFKWLGLPYCDVSEQKKIAQLFCSLGHRIEKQQQMVDALKKYKRGLLNQIFSAISKGSQRRKLRELVHVSGGKTPSMSNSLYWNGDIVWISSKDMKSSRISGSELKITNLALNEMTLYHPGTLLLVARSGILKHSLPLAILEVDATINQDIKALQVHGCNAFYLYYAILSQEDTIIRTLVKTGTTVQSLMMDSFLNIEIPTPDIDQQQRIIDKLAKLEKYVEVQEKELSLLSQMRNGLLQQLFI